MTPKLKAKWLDALRSGKYQQGHNTLHPTDKFCCLGVLCDVAEYMWEPVKINDEIDHYKCDAGEDWIENDDELEKLGLPEAKQRICYCMNDGTSCDTITQAIYPIETRRYTFAEIADWLEKNL